MAYVRLDTSDPERNPGWNFPPAMGERTVICDPRSGGVVSRAGCFTFSHGNVLDGLRYLQDQAQRRQGRWVGFLSYDLSPYLHESDPPYALSCPPLYAFSFFPSGVASVGQPIMRPPRVEYSLCSSFSREQYLQAVRQCKEYIAAGDVYQVNLSQRFTTALPDEPLSVYRRLMRDSPALYGALLDFGDFALISNSPELFLRVTPLPNGRRRVVTRPIKGTRARAAGMDLELRDSIKDQAELNMIVDLERNDLGRVCEIGSVKVTESRAIETHPTIYHGVATIEGILRRDVTFVDLLRATFPGGSVTGAPKIRAMQIIDELEPVPRGPYCGAIGWLASDGSMEFNVAIRTMIVKDGLVHIPVGGGIVADSDPQAEYEETLVKARAMFAALGIEAPEVQ